MFTKKPILLFLTVLLSLLLLSGTAAARPSSAPINTSFTYQGRLTFDGAPADGSYDFEFRLFTDSSGDTQLGSVVKKDSVSVTDGLFMVQLDFDNVFDGGMHYLEVRVRPGGSSDPYTTLTPRQALTAAPYAIFAASAPWSGLTDIPAGFADGVDNDTAYSAGTGLSLVDTTFNVTGVPWSGLTDVPAGFADGVDNDTTYSAGTGLSLVGTTLNVTDVSWFGLTYVPDGFADGVDNDTTYSAGEGLELIGTEFKALRSSFQNVVIVAKSGGDFTSIQTALDSIIDARAENPYLIYVAPGIYIEQVWMKPYVDIEGAGELTTKITFTGSTSPTESTVVGADHAELRFLTVENYGGDQNATAIFNQFASPRLTHVTVIVFGGTDNYGIFNTDNASPTMTNLTVSVSGDRGMNFGVNNTNATPTMTNMIIHASGASIKNYGVRNYSSSLTMTNVNASATGASEQNEGIHNDASSVTMRHVTVTAKEGTLNSGVINNQSLVTMTNVTANASGGTENYGIYNMATTGTYTVQVNNSQINGTNTIRNDSGNELSIGASQLSGGDVINIGGTVTCIGVYDENYTNINGYSSCP